MLDYRISDNGARLLLDSDIELPERFRVRLTETGKVSRGCQVFWRKHLILRVQFL
jgi:hypothetical protein